MPWYEAFDQAAALALPQLELRREEPMAAHTTFRVGGPARRMAFPKTEEELTALLSLAADYPCTLLGKGSDLLVSDGGLDRLVICTGKLDRVRRTGETELEAEAGASLAKAAMTALGEELTGLEFAHGIPGSLGGGVLMNAGAYGGEMKQVVAWVRAWYPERGVVTLPAEELDFSYRHSRFSGGEGVILAAGLRLTKGDREEIRGRMEELARRRREKQPLEYASAGSTFKRPEGYFAGTLIEQCGLKGYRSGGAQVSEKHAGFVINTGGATCADVLAVMRHVQETVYEKTGVRLEPEVRYLEG